MEAMTENNVACAEQGRSVPQLRFQEFEDNWNKVKLKEVSIKITDGTHDTPKTVQEGIPYLTAVNIKDGYIDYDNSSFLSTEDHNKIFNRCNPEKGDLLLVNIGAGTATCAINSVDYEFSLKNVALVKPNKSLINENFLEQTQRKERKKLFHRLTSGGAQPFLALKEIGKLKLTLPTLPEQQKIATFLSSVDTKLQQLSKKKSLLADYKKGVMQKIFSQELRFKDAKGNNYPDWEEKKLGEVSTKKSSNISANAIVENVGNYKLYGASGFLKGVDFYREESPFISIVKDGAGVGRVLLCEPFSSVLGTLDVIKPTKGNNLYFIYTLLQRIPFVKYTIGSTIPHIYFKDYSNEKVGVPKFEEQQKIVTFLSALDVKISTVNTQINNTQAFKKGLLQQMFV